MSIYKQNSILQALRELERENGYPPFVREIAVRAKCNPSTVLWHLRLLLKRVPPVVVRRSDIRMRRWRTVEYERKEQ